MTLMDDPSAEKLVQQLADLQLQPQMMDPYWQMNKLEMITAMEEKQQDHQQMQDEVNSLQSQLAQFQVLLWPLMSNYNAIQQIFLFFLLQLEIKQKNEEKRAFQMKIAEMEVRVKLMTGF